MTSSNKVLINILIFATILVAAVRTETPIRECANHKPLPLMVQMDDCAELPCVLHKGTDTQMAIQFVATKNSMSNLRADVRLTTLGAEIPYELAEERSNVCENLLFGAYCPLDVGEDVTYYLLMHVNEKQPEVRTKIEVNLVDHSDNSIVACFITDARIKKY